MTEDFLHYIWKYKLYNAAQLLTTAGEPITIHKAGEHNTNSGPDFFNAKIKIGDTLWAGNIELHIKSSDWEKHNHVDDKLYDSIILHVVYVDDKPIQRLNGETVPTLELKGKFDERIFEKYVALQKSKDWIPCAKQVKNVDSFVLNTWLERVAVERLERKATEVQQLLELNKNNWEETFYQSIAKSFGFKINALPFELTAKALPLNLLAKHKPSLFQLEALLFGQAGLLDTTFAETYPQYLQNEYHFLRTKHSLKPIDAHLWKFMRLRPLNFPTIRIAQFATLIFNSLHLFSKILEAESITELQKLFIADVSEYWETHYTFDVATKSKSKKLGEDAVHGLIINTVIPFLFVYGKLQGEEKYCDRALSFLERLDVEKNSIIENWNQLGVKAEHALHSQSLIELKNNYCVNKSCLSCGVGKSLLSTK